MSSDGITIDSSLYRFEMIENYFFSFKVILKRVLKFILLKKGRLEALAEMTGKKMLAMFIERLSERISNISSTLNQPFLPNFFLK